MYDGLLFSLFNLILGDGFMNQNDYENKHPFSLKKQKKRRFILFIVSLITLFFVSFSTTSFILIKAYRLTFAEEDYAQLQQQVELLRSELSCKENEIEELKLQLANIEGESSFANQMQNHGSDFIE